MSWWKTWSTSPRGRFGLVMLALIFVLAVLLLLAPPDGGERAQFLQFLGRFHPISVHLPIALLMLVPLLELAGRSRHFSYLLPSINFLLGIATLGAIGAALLGWLLGRNGGYSGPLVTQHMWGGVGVAALAWTCWALRARAEAGGRTNRLYFVALAAAVGLVSFTGYRGGQLSQGENHLTEFMPEPLQAVLGVSAAEPVSNSGDGGPGTFYGARIQPLFASHCVSCHGRSKHKGKLRLDSFDALVRGGKHGAVVKANETKTSELFRRITLAPTDDEFMPTDGKRPLSASDVKLIEFWIAAGASGTQAVDAIKDAPISSSQVADVTFEEVDAEAVVRQRQSLAPAVARLQQRFPHLLDYESRTSADIVVNASLMGPRFGDAELAALVPLNERIVSADLSNTAITDRSASILAGMKHLRELRLMHTKISDTTVQALAGLDQLQSLSLFDTTVTSASLGVVARLPKLRNVYVASTKIAPGAALPPEIKDKIVF